jgi:hypothetical protein
MSYHIIHVVCCTTKKGLALRNSFGRLTISARATQALGNVREFFQKAVVEPVYDDIETEASFARYTPEAASDI